MATKSFVIDKKLDLRNREIDYFKNKKPDAVINAAATVGGIYANNKYKAEFIFNNISIQSNIINISYKYGVKHLIFLDQVVYPRDCKQPIKENIFKWRPRKNKRTLCDCKNCRD